jgi:hypothetical protein
MDATGCKVVPLQAAAIAECAHGGRRCAANGGAVAVAAATAGVGWAHGL